jgi:hypothetical protein
MADPTDLTLVQLQAIRRDARSGFTAAGQRSVLLFDDVESIFMARGSQHAKEWHFSQDSVFFHSIDDLDTSRSVIVLTSNRPDLIDDAIRDRFLSYVIDYPDLETLIQMIEQIPALASCPTHNEGFSGMIWSRRCGMEPSAACAMPSVSRCGTSSPSC